MISAIVLTYNDELTIERTLLSLAWCDEVIVIDDSSTDKTVVIARLNHAKVFQHTLDADFAAQRNFGLSKANGDWVLFVDSDEVIGKELAAEIQKSLEVDCAGFYVHRRDWMFGRALTHGETGRVNLLRLAKKESGLWHRPVHEVWEVKGEVGQLVHPIDHYPHPDVAQFIKEINWYTTINARHMHEKNIRVPAWQILLYPVGKFFVDYVWYLGFLDGTPGAIVAIMMSFHSFLTRAKLWLLWHKGNST